MEYKTLMDGTKIPVLGMGTRGFGNNKLQDKLAIRVLREGIKLGMTHIDTAEGYANGHAEELIGEAIKPFKRKNIFLTTKVSVKNLRFNDVVSAIEGSLERLKVNFVDLYLIHWPNPMTPLKETMEALEYVVEQGYARYIGVSNFSVKLMKKAQSYVKQKIVANQVEYNLLHRAPDRNLLPYCQKNNIILIAYTPLAAGRLAKPGFRLLDELTKKYNRTQAQIALNWLISKDKVIAIPKSLKIEHLKENLGAIGWKLKKEDIEKLDKTRLVPPLEWSRIKLKKWAINVLMFLLKNSRYKKYVESIYFKSAYK